MICNVFKITGENCTKKSAKVGDTNFKKHYPGLSLNMSWLTLEPLIRQAQEKYVSGFICESIICQVAQKYQEDAELSPEEAKILELLQDTTAYYTICHGMPVINTFISDMGVQESNSSDGTSNSSTQWRYYSTFRKACNFADACLDKLLQYLDKLPSNHTIAEMWANCDIKKKCQNCFFQSPEDFNCHVDIRNSWRTYQAMMPHIRLAEKRFILPILCQEMYDKLCNQIKTGTLTPENKLLLSHVKPVLANFALKIAIPKLRVNIEDQGIRICSSNDGINQKQSAHDTMIEALRVQAEENAKSCRADLTSFLYENVEDYPEWKDSKCYRKEEDSKCLCKNSPENRIGGVYF